MKSFKLIIHTMQALPQLMELVQFESLVINQKFIIIEFGMLP